MAQVMVSIAGRQYRMACDDGEEAHLEALAVRLDAKITELRDHFGAIGDQRITVMAALTIADDLSQAEKRIGDLERQAENAAEEQALAAAQATEADDAVALSIEDMARRVERIARHLDALGSS
jgi:cell division protein ZapA